MSCRFLQVARLAREPYLVLSIRADWQLGASRVDAFYERKKLGIDGKGGGFQRG